MIKWAANDYKTCGSCKKAGSMVCLGNFCRACGHSNTASLVAAQLAALAAALGLALWLRSVWAWLLVVVLAVGDVCLLVKLWLEHRSFKQAHSASLKEGSG